MLKERDKKLLFYSWSYAFLASCLIYVCMGSGALAYNLVFTETNSYSSNVDEILSMTSWWGNESVTKLDWDLDHVKCGSGHNVSGSKSGHIHVYNTGVSSSVIRGNYSATWYIPGTATREAGTVDVLINDFTVPAGYENRQLAIDLEGLSAAIKNGQTCNSYYVTSYTNKHLVYPHCMMGPGSGSANSGYDIWATPAEGTFACYSGSDLPDAPVINDFTIDSLCYVPGDYPVLESDVTGSVDDWAWSVYLNSTSELVWDSDDSVETIVEHYFQPGLYDAQLTVSNDGGYDTMFKYQSINVTQPGVCNLTVYNPFPTQTQIVPTQAVFPTMTMPPHIVTNLTGINEAINQSIFGNMSQGYRDYFDYVGEQANTTFTGTINTLFSPIALVINGIAQAISLFSDSLSVLVGYTTVPLAITGKVINAMPWQIVTLITAGIAVDAILIIILGR